MTVHRTTTGRAWHWAAPDRVTMRTACTGRLLDTAGINPVAVDMGERCVGAGCARLWDAWVERTIRIELADALRRSRDENEQREVAA